MLFLVVNFIVLLIKLFKHLNTSIALLLLTFSNFFDITPIVVIPNLFFKLFLKVVLVKMVFNPLPTPFFNTLNVIIILSQCTTLVIVKMSSKIILICLRVFLIKKVYNNNLDLIIPTTLLFVIPNTIKQLFLLVLFQLVHVVFSINTFIVMHTIIHKVFGPIILISENLPLCTIKKDMRDQQKCYKQWMNNFQKCFLPMDLSTTISTTP
mmetsp:Transcript_17404/g.25885  ORF Transcript_17404/g.25885 Transcript_17404/m.25885 type:complete len:209 (+) Transcript_17404:101-727(+)